MFRPRQKIGSLEDVDFFFASTEIFLADAGLSSRVRRTLTSAHAYKPVSTCIQVVSSFAGLRGTDHTVDDESAIHRKKQKNIFIL